MKPVVLVDADEGVLDDTRNGKYGIAGLADQIDNSDKSGHYVG